MTQVDVLWTLGAESDVQAIYESFETQEMGLGDAFHTEVLRTARMLSHFPHLGPPQGHRGLRRILVFNRRFGLFYKPESRGVILLAVLDVHRDPEVIEERLREMT